MSLKEKIKLSVQKICMESGRTLSDVIRSINSRRPDGAPVLNFSCLTFTKIEQIEEVATALGMSTSDLIKMAESYD